MSLIAQQIVEILLEDARTCAACQKEFGIAPQRGESHGMCQRHFIEYYGDTFMPQEIKAMPQDHFCPDLAQQQQAQQHAGVAQ